MNASFAPSRSGQDWRLLLESDMLERQVIVNSVKRDELIFSGIYYLLSGEEIVYVGKSLNVYARVGFHGFEGKKDFDRVTVQKVAPDLLHEIEIAEIIRHNPRYNRSLPENDEYKNMRQMKEFLGMNAHGVKKLIKERGVKTVFMCGQLYYRVSDFG